MDIYSVYTYIPIASFQTLFKINHQSPSHRNKQMISKQLSDTNTHSEI